MFFNSPPAPTLTTIPSELRRIIVSYLAPLGPEDLHPGCKAHLKNANLAHSCLREWVPEFMFRDMALTHVVVGMASHLELFGANQGNAGLFKHVKTIQVKVPPAIRWEIDAPDNFEDIDDITISRLCKKFKVESPDKMTSPQRQFCGHYHRALVEPFTDNRRWYNLLRNAQASWGQVFRYFPNLTHIGVGCCEIVDHPAPTYTNVFVMQHGKDVQKEADPPFREDATANLAWASALILESAPAYIQSLDLVTANLDNFNSFATVNRLLSIVYRNSQFLTRQPPPGITKLCLTVRGVRGAHGDLNWNGGTGSAGGIRFWKKVLTCLKNLTYLEIREDFRNGVAFSDGELSDDKNHVVFWLLPELKLESLETVHLRKLCLARHLVDDLFARHWSNVKTIILDQIQLMLTEFGHDEMLGKEINIPAASEGDRQKASKQIRTHHLQGGDWSQICRYLSSECPDTEIQVNQPVSTTCDYEKGFFRPSSKYVEEIIRLPNVRLDVGGYAADVEEFSGMSDTTVDTTASRNAHGQASLETQSMDWNGQDLDVQMVL